MSGAIGDVATAVGLVGAATLIVAGVAKTYSPAVPARALEAARLPARQSLIRTLGVAEVAVGIAFLVSPGGLAAAVLAAFYVVFAAVVADPLMRGRRDQPCGCLGAAAASLGVTHLLFNVAVSVAAASVVPLAGFRRGLLHSHPLLAPALGVATYLAFLLLTEFDSAAHAFGSARGTRGGAA